MRLFGLIATLEMGLYVIRLYLSLKVYIHVYPSRNLDLEDLRSLSSFGPFSHRHIELYFNFLRINTMFMDVMLCYGF